MKKTTKFMGLAILSLSIAVAACSDDETTTGGGNGGGGNGGGGNGSGGNGSGGNGSGGGDPAPPTLGAQIDRAGRPAISTAATERFVASADHDSFVDGMNKNGDPSTWVTQYQASIASSIAVLDGLDATCGNQTAFDALGNPAYGTLSTILANDWLLVNTASSNAAGYLGIEADILGGGTGDVGGGRIPADDVIATSYTVLAGVAFDDGVVADEPSKVTTFPYLAAPH